MPNLTKIHDTKSSITDNEKPLFLFSSLFWGVNNPDFIQGIVQASNNVPRNGLYVGDNLFTINRNLGFLEDIDFMNAFLKNATTKVEQSIAWRTYIISWAIKSVLVRNIPGDFIECACYKGTTVKIICDYINFANINRKYYLYDLFVHDDSMEHHALEAHSENLFETVKHKFRDIPNVVITQGKIPEVLELVKPEKIAFMHIDLNNASSEIGTLEKLWDRLSPGGIIIFDDYGWRAYREQKIAEDSWFAKIGYTILELPTGQGLCFK